MDTRLMQSVLQNHQAISRGFKLTFQVEGKQRKVALVSEMIHTASLLHDDILDHALTRRGKASVNSNWDARKSTFAGNCCHKKTKQVHLSTPRYKRQT